MHFTSEQRLDDGVLEREFTLGEIPGTHHGTYRYGRWWWQAAGYTPAGVEGWESTQYLER